MHAPTTKKNFYFLELFFAQVMQLGFCCSHLGY
jgi:hypothetical protein